MVESTLYVQFLEQYVHSIHIILIAIFVNRK